MRALFAWPAAIVLAGSAHAAAGGTGPQPAAGSQTNPYTVTAALDQRLQDTAWRLTRANAPFCQNIVPGTGLLLQDMQAWADPRAARAALGLTSEISVGAAARGSPAQMAGLEPGDAIAALAGKSLRDLPPAPARKFERLADLTQLAEETTRAQGSLPLTVVSSGQPRGIVLVGVDVCASRFEIVTRGNEAEADGHRVLISADIALELASEDQFAFVVAHELAHNLLAHAHYLRRAGRSGRNLRHVEREADRLAVWLMANAGYDTAGAARFMKGWARRRGNGLFNPSHDGWDERLEGVEAEISLLGASPAQVGGYDWSSRFPLSREDAKSGR